ncbi:hypothetical protein HBI56_229940 [Parastagonospora nodorum]|nr:hypothetical protein HBH53_036480 [Parastagonospora nodorum]KAH3984709.1 hypothetical protein HBH51_026620 [Parastagonospora nodorum]KAH4000377.1 hypothetical protein HBI10_099400 [Parastagonospora nodorum]KAH4026744.1 hypothetical protein HBI13_066200 [Parastagonospora nodorum]KAH4089817.1 hypothetical protein HBH46_191790 [Parastagonospora nodorum]
MTTPKRPQSATGDTPSTSQYHSAYNGYVADQGRFMHFIRSPDQSHLEFGYWCFSTTQDEARAFGRGYHTPEEILIAADSGEGEFAEINMLWIPGRVDRVLKSQICGSAKQHTRAIYDMRVFLGKSLSFRGCAPTYPMDQRLEDYWASRRIPASVLTDPPVLQSTNRPPPPIQITRLPSPAIGPNTGPQRTYINNPRTQSVYGNTFFSPVSNGTISSRMRSPVYVPVTRAGTPSSSSPAAAPPSQVSPTTFAQTYQSNDRAAFGGHGAQAMSSPNAAAAHPQNTAHQVQYPTGDTNYHNGPTHNVTYLQAPPPRRRPPYSLQSPYLVPGLLPKPFHNASSPVQMQSPYAAQQNVQFANTTQAGAPSVVQRQTAYRSQPYNSTPYGAPAAQSAPCPPVPYNERKPLRTPQSYGVQDLPGSHPRPIAQHNTPGANSTLYSNFELPTMHQTGPMPQQLPSSATITDPRLVGHDQNPGSAAAPIDFSFEDDEPITVAPDEVVVDEGTTTAAGVTTAVRQPAPISEQIEPETRQIKSLQRQLLTDGNDEGRFKRPETSDNRQDSLTTTSDQLPTPDAVLEMPCMDCGEEVEKGHKAGCHLGENSNTFIANPMQANEVTDIAPMKLTVLDHRVLADCVERFDPGPWTTHQGPPAEPELETPEDQIRGMADIIRNEDTYKSDAELCLLPDDLMILAWAMKTAPNIEVICE